MTINPYTPPTMQQWKGRIDAPLKERIHEWIKPLDLNTSLPNQGVCFIGFRCDAGIERNQGRPGAKEGPSALRAALASLPCPLPLQNQLYDCGDVTCEGDELETAQETLASCVAQICQRGCIPIVLGGGHELAWGHFQGLQRAHPNRPFSVINCDAHFDLRAPLAPSKGSSGSPFFQMAAKRQEEALPFPYLAIGIQESGNTPSLFQKAKELNAQWILAKDILNLGNLSIREQIDSFVNQSDGIYLTICLDVFSAAIAPGVSAPQSLGLFPQHLLSALLAIAQSGKILGFDIAELSPPYDRDQQTAKFGANLIYTLIDQMFT